MVALDLPNILYSRLPEKIISAVVVLWEAGWITGHSLRNKNDHALTCSGEKDTIGVLKVRFSHRI